MLDRYVVVAPLGQGGMADVYRARHLHLKTEHALKILHVARPDIRRRLLDEGRLQARLRHPNIVRVTDVILVGEAPGLVMDLVEGPSLAELLARPLDIERAEAWFREIVAGVAFAHAAGVIHRDIKPGNVLMERVGGSLRPRVADFGIAKLLRAEVGGQTRTGQMMGSPAYMAPEQARDASGVDARADIWSLGCLLYEMVCGARPFVGGTLLAVLAAVTSGEYAPPRGAPPRSPAEDRPRHPRRAGGRARGALRGLRGAAARAGGGAGERRGRAGRRPHWRRHDRLHGHPGIDRDVGAGAGGDGGRAGASRSDDEAPPQRPQRLRVDKRADDAAARRPGPHPRARGPAAAARRAAHRPRGAEARQRRPGGGLRRAGRGRARVGICGPR